MLLSLRGISKRFDGSRRPRPALQDVSLELERGQMIGVFGPSGAGKTTLLQIAAGLQTPDSGEALYDGERLHGMSSAQRTRLRRREIACLFSQPPRSHMGVLEHIAVALLIDGSGRRSARRRARAALLACEAEHCAGAELHELSDGERQLVEIARAIVVEPRLLLADGPTSSLSLVEQETIMALLCTLAREARVGVLIAAADAEALVGADPILYLREGRMLAGAPGDATIYQFPDRPRVAAADA
jgi:putative ABC transport system ATP-binding protein